MGNRARCQVHQRIPRVIDPNSSVTNDIHESWAHGAATVKAPTKSRPERLERSFLVLSYGQDRFNAAVERNSHDSTDHMSLISTKSSSTGALAQRHNYKCFYSSLIT